MKNAQCIFIENDIIVNEGIWKVSLKTINETKISYNKQLLTNWWWFCFHFLGLGKPVLLGEKETKLCNYNSGISQELVWSKKEQKKHLN